jgi:hypothetical protein
MFGNRQAKREVTARQYDQVARDLTRQREAHDRRGGDVEVSDDLLTRAASASEAARLIRQTGKPNPRLWAF